MDWNSYAEKFKSIAFQGGYTTDDINQCLNYAKKLSDKRIPIIYDPQHLASLVGFNLDYLRKASNAPKRFYRRFKIPKKNNRERIIHEPLPNLKEIQRWILDNILYKCKFSSCAKAFIKERSIKDNAYFHKNQKYVLKLDVVDFFGSIKRRKIYLFFHLLGYSQSVAGILANLCCLRGRLPQGAPTSPALSNLIATRIDRRIFGYAKKNKIRYTRYADDMTFSGVLNAGDVIRLVKKVISSEGLKLNEKKTRLMERHQSQQVTGIVVNEKLQVPRQERREIRKSMYFIEKYGLSSHMERTHCQKANYIKHLLGKIEFAKFVNPIDKVMQKYEGVLRNFLKQQANGD